MFINIIPINNFSLIQEMMLFFNLSIFMHLISIIATLLNIEILPSFLVAQEVKNPIEYRFCGLFGGYELFIDYIMIVITFSLWFILKRKYVLLSYITLIISLFLAILTGTRSFIVVFIIFVFVYVLLAFIKSERKIKNFLRVIMIFIFLFIMFEYFTPEIFISTLSFRSQETLNYIGFENIEKVSNRDWSEAFPIVINQGGVLGHGAFLSTEFFDHYMIPHCLYFDIYSKFGILGILCLIILFINILKISLNIWKNDRIRISGKSLFPALLIALFVQQIKISSLRYIHTILIYAFLFIVIYSLYNIQMRSCYGD